MHHSKPLVMIAFLVCVSVASNAVAQVTVFEEGWVRGAPVYSPPDFDFDWSGGDISLGADFIIGVAWSYKGQASGIIFGMAINRSASVAVNCYGDVTYDYVWHQLFMPPVNTLVYQPPQGPDLLPKN